MILKMVALKVFIKMMGLQFIQEQDILRLFQAVLQLEMKLQLYNFLNIQKIMFLYVLTWHYKVLMSVEQPIYGEFHY